MPIDTAPASAERRAWLGDRITDAEDAENASPDAAFAVVVERAREAQQLARAALIAQRPDDLKAAAAWLRLPSNRDYWADDDWAAVGVWLAEHDATAKPKPQPDPQPETPGPVRIPARPPRPGSRPGNHAA